MANEKRLIDLDKAFEAINLEIWWTESEKSYFRSFLAKQQKVDAVPVVHGRWLESTNTDYMMSQFTCSECGVKYIAKTWNYCPNCGADMRGDGNG